MGTYMEELLDPEDISEELLCCICTGMYLDPQICPCGHVYCGYCIEEALKRNARCPLCRAKIKRTELKDCRELREQCDAVMVCCPWRCNWTGRRDEQAEHATVCPVGQFINFTVDIEGALDVRFEILDDCMLVGNIEQEGGIWLYNQQVKEQGLEERAIYVNDQVVQVDGVCGEPHLLAYLITRPHRKTITFRHPQELAVSIVKGGKKLGIDLTWSNPNGVLTVIDVLDGAVHEYNYARSHSEQLQKNDRIIEVNGVSGLANAKAVMPILLEAETCMIKFHRPRHNSLCSL